MHLQLFIVVFLGNFSFGKDTDFFLHLGAVIFISIYQMTPLPHLLQCALRYYDSAANVSCDAAIG